VAEVSLTGGCQCGAVRYALRSPQWSAICHCRMCQKASGQPFMAFIGGDADKIRWTRGKAKTFRSSEMAERGFCADCGTPLTYAHHNSLSVTLMSLDNPAGFPPTAQNGIESKAAWVDDLHRLPAERADDWIRSLGRENAGSHQHPDREKA
jgi:hypothetical protein